MKRKSGKLLAFGALLGAVATAALVVLILGGGGSRARGSGPGGAADAGSNGRRGDRLTQVVADGDRVGPGGMRLSGGGVGSRQPSDGPELIRAMAENSSRVTEILLLIQAADAQGVDERQKLYLELRTLIRTLGHRVDRHTRDTMLRMLTEVEEKWRPLVGDALGYLQGDVETAKALMEMLKEQPKSVYTRNAILTAIGKMNVKEVLPDLVATIGEGYDSEALIVRAIGQIGGPEASEVLLAQLDRPLRRDTILEMERVIGQAKNAIVMARIERELADAPPKARASMINILGMAGDAEYAPAVHELLKNESDPSIRRSAIQALGRFGDAKSGEMLLEILQNGSEEERQTATNAMHRVREPETVNRLAEEWDRLGDPARIAVLGAGSRLPQPGDKLTEIAREGVRDRTERIRTASVRILGQRGRDDHVDILSDYLLRAGNSREKSVALHALRQIGTRKAAEAGIQGLHVLPERQRQGHRAQFERILQQAQAPER